MAIRLGDEAPDFTAETTEGTLTFHEWRDMLQEARGLPWRQKLAVLFGKPAGPTSG